MCKLGCNSVLSLQKVFPFLKEMLGGLFKFCIKLAVVWSQFCLLTTYMKLLTHIKLEIVPNCKNSTPLSLARKPGTIEFDYLCTKTNSEALLVEMSFLGMCLSVRCGSKSKNMLRLFLLPIFSTCKQIFRLRLSPAALQETLIPHFHKELSCLCCSTSELDKKTDASRQSGAVTGRGLYLVQC